MSLRLMQGAALVLVCGSLFSAAALAQEPPKAVEIKGMKDPELRLFRSVTTGLDTFDEYRELAPAVGTLRFRLKARESTLDKSTDTITLKIVGDSPAIPVAIEADGGFTIARNQSAYDENAELVFNRKRRQFMSIADIRTPGVPANARRLGDLRLECLVNIAIIKTEIPFLVRATINTFLLTTDWCRKLPIYMSLPPTQHISKATLIYGERRRELTHDEFSNGFESPLLDPAWPDDTLLEMQLAPEMPAPVAAS
ncbi:hypothetical protein [Massilia sp. CF038]|uniref:hypothetical protein n=1 Tax=Massilia sp. CF038 TaxID=1881045 RepID=UPI000916E261|nr:hypothetical protein [Massilia sp. CF038]SHH01920.1 hypothetical protein SAMN05428948_2354 [Massilia sp. CF038]